MMNWCDLVSVAIVKASGYYIVVINSEFDKSYINYAIRRHWTI
jgi:hypothetical protein